VKRERARLVERLDLAEVQAEALLQFGMKPLFGKRDNARGIRPLLGPYQR
jgi:hypothetical protein